MSKTKAITKDIVENTYTQRFLFRIILGSLLSFFIVYIYLIGSITFNVVAYKSLNNTARNLGSNISQLELTYLNSMSEVNKTLATSLGFEDTKQNIFATRYINHVAIR